MSTKSNPPEPISAPEPRVPATVEPIRPELIRASGPTPEAELPGLADYLGTLLEHRRLISVTAALFVAGGVVYAWAATPIYRADAVVQIEEKPKGINGLDELTGMMSAATPAQAEMEVIRSRRLLGAAIDELRLDVQVTPERLPLFGAAVARRNAGTLRSPLLALGGYAWGGEKVHVAQFDLPESMKGTEFTLLAGQGGRYRVLGPAGEELGAGRVGEPLRSVDGAILITLDELSAHDGTRFTLVHLPRDAVIANLKARLQLREVGKQTGILELALQGPNPDELVATLDAIARRYLRQNVERRSEEAERTLEFLNSQLPQLKANVDAAEQALNAYRQKKGSVDVSLETKGTLDKIVDLEKSMSQLEMQRAELRQRFTESHPALALTSEKMARLQGEREAVNARIRQVPQAELELAGLMRDVKVANELYVLLLNKAQELNVTKSGTIGNVRILDTAVVPRRPVAPRKARVVLLSLAMGLAVGVALAWARRSFHHGVDDPDAIERATGLSVHATIPHSAHEMQLERELQRGRSLVRPMLAAVEPGDPAVEAIRSLRTSVEFALAETGNNVVAIGGPTAGIGKSFVSTNLAFVMAETGKRVLLVDADMRRGSIHHVVGADAAPGLAEVVSGVVRQEEARRMVSENLHVISRGKAPPNPSEMLTSQRFKQFAAWAQANYDIVIFDTPPILPVTDGALVSRLAGVNLLVARAGEHRPRDLHETVRRYVQKGVQPYAFVLNDVKPKLGRYGYRSNYEYK